jgi:hypothetical protein
MQPRRSQERRADRHTAHWLADHQHGIGLSDTPALPGEPLDQRCPQLGVRAGQQAVVKPPAEEPASHPAALRAPPPQDGQYRVRVAGIRPVGEPHLRRGDSFLGEKDGDLVKGVLPGDRRGDLPDDEVANRAAIVLSWIRSG